MRDRDLDAQILTAARELGLIGASDVARIEALLGEERQARKPSHVAQLLVREGLISCKDLVRLLDQTEARPYTCPDCGRTHPRQQLPQAGGEGFPCQGCGRTLRLQAKTQFSPVEVLSARDPLELTIPLEVSESVEGSGSAAEISQIDLERYTVLSELGRGAYGVVFRVRDADLGREVALKVLRSRDGLNEIALERFVREARSVSRVKHRNLIQVYDVGRHRDLYMMVMELVEGRSLRAVRLEADGKRLAPARALSLTDEVLAGLAKAHDEGIVHRDLKPANVLVESLPGGGERPRLIDFGLAKDLDADSTLTQAGAIVGTPAYLSPEQVKGESDRVDTRTDVFAVAVMLYELLAGERPFVASTKAEIYRKILLDEPRPLTELAPEVSPAVAAVIARAMDKAPARRYADASELREALREAAEAPAVEQQPRKSKSGRLKQAKQTGKRKRARSRRVPRVEATPTPNHAPWIAGGVAVALLLLGIVLGSGSPSPTQAAATTPAGAAVTPAKTPGLDGPPVAEGGGKPRPYDGNPEPVPTPESSIEPRTEPSPEAGEEPSADPGEEPSPDPGVQTDPEAEPDPDTDRRGGVYPRPSQPESDPEPEPRQVAEIMAEGLNLRAGPGTSHAKVKVAVRGDRFSLGEGRDGDWVELILDDGQSVWAHGRYLRLEDPAAGGPQADRPGPGSLDAGAGDADEFPDLAKRSRGDWLERAFLINDMAEDPDDPRTIRGLRYALGDRFPLNQAFALRGLVPAELAYLRGLGSQALFDGLVGVLGSKEPYVKRTSRLLLARLTGESGRGSARKWRTWWQDEGEAKFLEWAKQPLPARRAARAGGSAGATQVREATTYISRLRERGLEIAFLMDVTVSMTDELQRVRSQVTEITSILDLLLDGKVRLGFAAYGDDVVQAIPLTRRLDRFARGVEQIKIFNDPNDRTIEEGVSRALEYALGAENKFGWKRGPLHVLLLLGDAPPLAPDRCRDLAKQAKANDFVLNALIAPAPENYKHKGAKAIFTELADLAGGMAVEIEDPEELITRLLVLSFGSRLERELRLFVHAYREVTGEANSGD